MLALSEKGYLQREVARQVGCKQRNVSDTLKKQLVIGCASNRKIIGRKRKTRTKEDWTHRHKSEVDRFRTAREIKTEMQVEHGERISSSTSRRFRSWIEGLQVQTNPGFANWTAKQGDF